MTSVHIHGFGPNGELSPGAEAALTAWAGPGGGVTDHGALSGLDDDDHTQYHTDARGDARYYTQGQVDALVSGATPVASGSTLPRALSLAVVGLANCDTTPFKILFVGDSLTWSGSAWVDRFVARLAALTGEPGVTLKSKVSGDVSIPADGIYGVNCAADAASSGTYITNGNAEAMATALQPHLVIHGIGTNNHMGSTPLNTFKGHIEGAIADLDAACTVPPAHLFWLFGSLYFDKPYDADDYLGELVTIASGTPDRVAVADLGPYADALGVHNADPYSLDGGDGLHLTSAGYKTIGELMARIVTAVPAPNVVGYSAAAPAEPSDTTAPTWSATFTMGTPTTTSVTATASAMATDDTAVTGYEVSYNGGTDWAHITPAGSVFTLAGTAGTTYSTTQLRAVDAAANASTPLNVPSYTMDTSADVTNPTAGSLGVVVGSTTADGTVTGASDETALDAAPYSFRVDAGSWSAWQAGATYEWTGLTAETEYDFQHRVRDSSGNISEGTVVTDTTEAATGVTFSYLDSDAHTTSATTHTFAGMDLGAEAAGREIIVAVAAGGQFVSSVTVAGVTATQDVKHDGGSTSTAYVGRAAVPTGTTGNVVVTMTGGTDRCSVALWRASGAVTAVSTNTVSPISLTTAADDFCVFVGVETGAWPGFTGTPTPTERASVTMGSSWTGAFADSVATGATADASASSVNALAGVAYRPA